MMLVSASGLWVKTSFGLTAFGRSLPVIAAACVSKIECNPVVATDSINWQCQCKWVVKSMQLRTVNA